MDVYQGQFDFTLAHSTQIHDFIPGFGPSVGGSGLGTRVFWTAAIPEDDVEVNFAAGKAEMHGHDLALRDSASIPVALGPNFQTAFVPATVSFDVAWNRPVTRRLNVRDGTNGNPFAGEFVEDRVTVSWSGSNAAGFRFHSNPGNFATSVDAFAELGHERNGTFVGEGEGDDDSGSSAPLGRARSAVAGPVQAFATPALPGENGTAHSLSAALALGDTDLTLPAPDLTNGAADHSAENLATEIGLQGEDILLR